MPVGCVPTSCALEAASPGRPQPRVLQSPYRASVHRGTHSKAVWSDSPSSSTNSADWVWARFFKQAIQKALGTNLRFGGRSMQDSSAVRAWVSSRLSTLGQRRRCLRCDRTSCFLSRQQVFPIIRIGERMPRKRQRSCDLGLFCGHSFLPLRLTQKEERIHVVILHHTRSATCTFLR